MPLSAFAEFSTSSRLRVPCMSCMEPVKYPSVRPPLENIPASRSKSYLPPSMDFRQASAAQAMYSGRFILPSIFSEAIPMSSSSRRCGTSELSFREITLCLSPQVKSRRQGCAQRPLLPLLPPKMLLM